MHLGPENSVEINATGHGCVGVGDVGVFWAVGVRHKSVYFRTGLLEKLYSVVYAFLCPAGG